MLTGRIKRSVSLRTRLADDPDADWVDVDLRRSKSDDPERAEFLGLIGQIHKAHEYQFVTSAGSCDIYRIDVRYPVRIEAIEVTVKRPAYTGLEDRVFEKTDVTVLAGSEVACRIRTQRPLKEVHVDFEPLDGASLDQAEIVAEDSGDGMQWAFRFTAETNARWTLRGADAVGTPMDPLDGQVRVKQDRPPKIRWTAPSESLFVHTLAEVPMRVRVEDDYGLSEAAIRFEISGNEGYTLDSYEMPINEDGTIPDARKVSGTHPSAGALSADGEGLHRLLRLRDR